MSYKLYRRFEDDTFEYFVSGPFETEQEAVDFYNKHFKPEDMDPLYKSVRVEYIIKQQNKTTKL